MFTRSRRIDQRPIGCRSSYTARKPALDRGDGRALAGPNGEARRSALRSTAGAGGGLVSPVALSKPMGCGPQRTVGCRAQQWGRVGRRGLGESVRALLRLCTGSGRSSRCRTAGGRSARRSASRRPPERRRAREVPVPGSIGRPAAAGRPSPSSPPHPLVRPSNRTGAPFSEPRPHEPGVPDTTQTDAGRAAFCAPRSATEALRRTSGQASPGTRLA